MAEIEFGEWTRDGRLRAPVYLGLRDDKPAADVVVERMPIERDPARPPRAKLSNLDKLFWPDEGITKGDLLAYYRDVAPVLVPHLRDRPFTMKRYPDGWQGKFFFQKDAPSHMPDWIPRAPFPASTREGEKRDHRLPARERRPRAPVDGQHGLHRHERVDVARRPARPARLDHVRPRSFRRRRFPGGDRGGAAREAAARPGGLESFPKTSGSRGIHVLVPIARRQGFDATRSFAAVVAVRSSAPTRAS